MLSPNAKYQPGTTPQSCSYSVHRLYSKPLSLRAKMALAEAKLGRPLLLLGLLR